MSDNVMVQSDWISPAESGAMLVIAVDSTSREYDLSLADIGVAFAKKSEAKFYINMSADGADVYYTMSAASGKTVDDTAALAAGVAVSGFTANGADIVFKGTKEMVYIDRALHRYLQIKTSAGTGKLRIRISSCLRPGDFLV